MAVLKIFSLLLPLLSIFLILLAVTGQAVEGRNVPTNTNKDEVKRPEFFIGHDGSFLIPGFGRVLKPHKFVPYTAPTAPFNTPRAGGSSGTGAAGPPSRNYVPGGDDTYVPNPGFEVPNPGHP